MQWNVGGDAKEKLKSRSEIETLENKYEVGRYIKMKNLRSSKMQTKSKMFFFVKLRFADAGMCVALIFPFVFSSDA